MVWCGQFCKVQEARLTRDSERKVELHFNNSSSSCLRVSYFTLCWLCLSQYEIQPGVVKAVSGAATLFVKKMASDLEHFSRHAGRQQVNVRTDLNIVSYRPLLYWRYHDDLCGSSQVDDCKLLCRNLPVCRGCRSSLVVQCSFQC